MVQTLKRSVFITVMFKLIGYCRVDINFLGANSTPPSPTHGATAPKWDWISSVSKLHDHNQGDTPHTVRLLCTSDQTEADTST
jgi:hypothetical protein